MNLSIIYLSTINVVSVQGPLDTDIHYFNLLMEEFPTFAIEIAEYFR